MVEQIVKFKSKYGSTYYDASTPEALNAACVDVLRTRTKEGYWYRRDYAEEFEAARQLSNDEREALQLTDAQIEGLPDSLKQKFQALRQSAARKQAVWERAKAREDAWFDQLDKVLNHPADQPFLTGGEEYGRYGQNKPLSYLLLNDRKDFQYEGFEVITLQTPGKG